MASRAFIAVQIAEVRAVISEDVVRKKLAPWIVSSAIDSMVPIAVTRW